MDLLRRRQIERKMSSTSRPFENQNHLHRQRIFPSQRKDCWIKHLNLDNANYIINQPEGAFAVAQTKSKHPKRKASRQDIDCVLHHDVGLVLQGRCPRLEESEPCLDAEHHEDVREDPGGVVMLPVADILVHWGLHRGVGGHKCLLIIILGLFVEIFVDIFLLY